jgi:hypothetical protein
LIYDIKEALLKGVMCAALIFFDILLDTDNFQKTHCFLCTKALCNGCVKSNAKESEAVLRIKQA